MITPKNMWQTNMIFHDFPIKNGYLLISMFDDQRENAPFLFRSPAATFHTPTELPHAEGQRAVEIVSVKILGGNQLFHYFFDIGKKFKKKVKKKR